MHCLPAFSRSWGAAEWRREGGSGQRAASVADSLLPARPLLAGPGQKFSSYFSDKFADGGDRSGGDRSGGGVRSEAVEGSAAVDEEATAAVLDV